MRLLITLVIVGGGAYGIYNAVTGGGTFNKIVERVKSIEMKQLFNERGFHYFGARMLKVVLSRDTTRENTYSGEVVFEWKGKTCQRPICVVFKYDRDRINYFYGLDFDYENNPDYLKEDAEIIFTNIVRSNSNNNPQLKSLRFVSAENLSSGVVRCIVKDTSTDERFQVDIKVNSEIDPASGMRSRFPARVIDVKEYAGR